MTDEEKNKLLYFEVRKTIHVSEPVYPDDPEYDILTELYEDSDENETNQS